MSNQLNRNRKLDLSTADLPWQQLAFFGKILLLTRSDFAVSLPLPVLTGIQARSSGGEHFLDVEGVGGSNPPVPTNFLTLVVTNDQCATDIFVNLEFLNAKDEDKPSRSKAL